MNKTGFIFMEGIMSKFMVLLLFVISVIGCAGNVKTDGKPQGSNTVDFKDKEWKLIEVLVAGKYIDFDRKDLETQKVDNYFTLKIDSENLSGIGAPNRYSAPYSIDGNKIKTMPFRTTLIAAFWQPENLKENDFFLYMQNIFEWAMVVDRLELTSKTKDGNLVKLVFTQ